MTERVHPFRLIFDTELEGQLDQIDTEAQVHEIDLRERDRFSMLVSVGELLRTLLPDDAPPEMVRQLASLLFYCYHYRAAGKIDFDIDEAVLRELLSTGFIAGPWEMQAPSGAGYIKLPRNRVWSRITEDFHAEAIDGFFFVDCDVLFILGLMAGRPGFSIMEVVGTAAPAERTSIAQLKARAEGEDFANVLPGGELQGHFAVTNNVEALKLASRCFWHLRHSG